MFKNFKKNKKGNGFTIIELIVVIFVLVTGLLGVLVVFPIGMKMGKNSQSKTIGIQLCQKKIEQLISNYYNDIQLSIGTTTENYGTISNFDYFKRVTRINYYDPLISDVTSTDLGIKKIEVEIFWRSSLKNSEGSTGIKSFISKK